MPVRRSRAATWPAVRSWRTRSFTPPPGTGGFRVKARAPCRPRTKGKDERGFGHATCDAVAARAPSGASRRRRRIRCNGAGISPARAFMAPPARPRANTGPTRADHRQCPPCGGGGFDGPRHGVPWRGRHPGRNVGAATPPRRLAEHGAVAAGARRCACTRGTTLTGCAGGRSWRRSGISATALRTRPCARP